MRTELEITKALVERLTDWQGFWTYNSLLEIGRKDFTTTAEEWNLYISAKTDLGIALFRIKMERTEDLCLPYSIANCVPYSRQEQMNYEHYQTYGYRVSDGVKYAEYIGGRITYSLSEKWKKQWNISDKAISEFTSKILNEVRTDEYLETMEKLDSKRDIPLVNYVVWEGEQYYGGKYYEGLYETQLIPLKELTRWDLDDFEESDLKRSFKENDPHQWTNLGLIESFIVTSDEDSYWKEQDITATAKLIEAMEAPNGSKRPPSKIKWEKYHSKFHFAYSCKTCGQKAYYYPGSKTHETKEDVFYFYSKISHIENKGFEECSREAGVQRRYDRLRWARQKMKEGK